MNQYLAGGRGLAVLETWVSTAGGPGKKLLSK
jgi:hypothetical protein